jgi:uncharacterized protein YndB with AHSA1/START domain
MTPDPVKASIRIEAPPERVYEHFVNPEAMVRWMGEHAVLDPEGSGRFELDVHGAPVRGRYLDLEPPHRLLISWGYAGSDALPPGASTVEIRLIADEGGTQVELEHRDLPTDQVSGHVRGWDHYLDRLRIRAAGGDPGPDPGMDQ